MLNSYANLQFMIIYLNRKYLPAHQACISIDDAGFLYGEGVFTTLRLYRGQPVDLTGHWQRLQHQGQLLDINLPLSEEEIFLIVQELVKQNELLETDARLRITLTPGSQPAQAIAEPQVPNISPTLLITVTPLPQSINQANQQGIAVITLGPDFIRGNQPSLKSLSFLASKTALRQAHNSGCSEAIMADAQGNLTEAALSNVFLVQDNRLLHPLNDGRILAGRTRQWVLRLAAENGLDCTEQNLTLIDLKNSDEVFLCNSIREILPVVNIDGIQVGDGQPGNITKHIQQLYGQDIRNRAHKKKTPTLKKGPA